MVRASESAPGRHGASLAILTLIFFLWGFITVLLDVLVPHLRSVFALTYTEVTMIQFVFFGTYFLAAPTSAAILEKLGYERSIAGDLSTSAAGTLLFFPSATGHPVTTECELQGVLS